jgi:hypothetical protein
MARDMLFDLAELARKGKLLVLAQILMAEDEDVMVAEGGEDGLMESR